MSANPAHGGRSPERRMALRAPSLIAGRNAPLPRVWVADVIEAAARHTGVPAREIMSHWRHAEKVEARHLAIEVAMQITGQSTTAVGRVFGRRDHTTVLHARGKIGARWVAGHARTMEDLRAIARVAIEIAEARCAPAVGQGGQGNDA